MIAHPKATPPKFSLNLLYIRNLPLLCCLGSCLQNAVQVAITVLVCWLASGIVFGFAALKPVLISEGVYREQCTGEELKQDVEVCLEQDIR
jgi:hypothetical protein